jgi:MscS family membrane protein
MVDLTSYMPEVLRRHGPLEVLWWQWLALPLLIVASFAFGAVLGKLTRWGLTRVVRRTDATWDDALLEALADPLRWAWSVLLFRAFVEILELHAAAERTVGGVVRALLFLVFFWALIRGLDQVRRSLAASAWAREKPIARSLVPLAVRVAKAVVFIIALISMLSELGYPVAGLIAGLGIGGIALALAAQKTVENLFGAFSIGLDQPFREGDGVKIGEFSGTVESIGLRSTRIRTADRNVVTIPNSQVAESKIESFAERDRLRVFLKLGLVHETSVAALRAILDDIRGALSAHPKIDDDEVDVRFVGFGASALDLEIQGWFHGNEWDAFKAVREELLMKIIEIVEQRGSAIALPSQTLHVASLPAAGTGGPVASVDRS